MLCYIVDKIKSQTFTARKYAETEDGIVEKYQNTKSYNGTMYSGFRFYKKNNKGDYKQFLPMDKPDFTKAIK